MYTVTTWAKPVLGPNCIGAIPDGLSPCDCNSAFRCSWLEID